MIKILSSSLFRAAGIYGFFSMLNSAIPFFLLPITTRYLTPSDYGMVSIFAMMVSLLVPFVGMNAHGAYSRAYFAQDRFDPARYMGTIILFSLSTFMVMCAITAAFGNFISRLFAFDRAWLLAVPVTALGLVMVQLTLTAWQVREQPGPYGIFQNVRTLAEVGGAILLVVLFRMGWQGMVLSRVVSYVALAWVGLYLLVSKGWLSICLDRAYLFHALCFSIPLIPHSLAGILNTTIDRFFIAHMVGLRETGLYTVGYQIGSLIGLAATAFNQAYAPWLLRKLNKNSYREKTRIVAFTYAYFLLIITASVAFGLISPFLIDFLVGKNFKESTLYVMWISLGFAFTGTYYMVVNYIFYAEKTYILAIVTLGGSLINCLLNYFFIKQRGPVGAAQATALSNFIIFVLVWFLSSKVYYMPWNPLNLIRYFKKERISAAGR
jgi:O-antigen/teichoic acid export membrane protein